MTDESLKELVASIAVAQKETDRQIKTLFSRVGGLRNSIGEVVEMVLLPGIKAKMNELQHKFYMSSPRKEFYRPDGSRLTEVDLFLENCDEVMVVEAKTNFRTDDVDCLINRLKTLRDNQAITGVSGKTMYAAAAGMDIDTDARPKILENGIYLVKIDEDNDRIEVTKPTGGTARAW